MDFIVLFFIFVQMIFLLSNRKIYFLLQKLTGFLAEAGKEQEKPKIVLLNGSSLFFPIYLVADFLYMLFCLWLLFTDTFWQPGGMLFLLTALETYAFHAKISSVFFTDKDGFIYPRSWARFLFSGLSIYILTRLYYSI